MSLSQNGRKLAIIPTLIPVLMVWQVISGKAGDLDGAYPATEKRLDSGEQSDSSVIDYFEELKLVTPLDATAGDQFGRSAIISGTLLIVGAVLDDDKGTDSGSIYFFERDEGGVNNWGQVKKLTAADGTAQANFSVGLALDGDTLVVGAHDDVPSPGAGSVYVYERNLGGVDQWGERIKIVPFDGSTNDRFGWDVSIDEDTLIVGAMWDDTACTGIGCNSGSVYIYERNQGGPDSWGFIKKLVPADLQSDDQFGRVVRVSGDTLFVSAGATDLVTHNRLGRIYVFERNLGGTNNWGQSKIITASDGFLNNNFGFSMGIFGDTLLVGARNDHEAATDAGAIYFFDRETGGTGNWGETLKMLAPDAQAGDRLGTYVSIYENTVVVTANREDEAGSDGGAAYVFSRPFAESIDWSFENKLIGSQVGENDEFGAWASISEDTLVIGGHKGNFAGAESGEAYYFRRVPPPTPTPTTTPTSTPTATRTPRKTNTPGPTSTPSPTNTPTPPASTPTPTSTNTPGSGGQIHVADLDAGSQPNGTTRWDALVEITIVDQNGAPVPNAIVAGAWGGGVSGSGSCLTDGAGKCTVLRLLIRNTVPSVTFTVTGVTAGGFTYDPGANTDPDGDSDGTTIQVNKP